MRTNQTILSIREYGKVSLRLKQLMDQRGMTRNELANSIHTRFEVVDKWYRGDVSKIDLDILARICYVMGCTVEELLIYEAP